jgi:hypothetical protein
MLLLRRNRRLLLRLLLPWIEAEHRHWWLSEHIA